MWLNPPIAPSQHFKMDTWAASLIDIGLPSILHHSTASYGKRVPNTVTLVLSIQAYLYDRQTFSRGPHPQTPRAATLPIRVRILKQKTPLLRKRRQ